MKTLIEEDSTPPVLLLVNRDVMSGIAIANAAKAVGLRFQPVASVEFLMDRVSAPTDRIALVVLDMNVAIDWDVVSQLTANAGSPPVIGFGPHVDIEGRRRAKSAGLTRILSNSEFHQKMGEIIRRYAEPGPIEPE